MPGLYPLSPLFDARRIAQDKAEILVAERARSCERAEQYEADVAHRLESIRQRMAADARALLQKAESRILAVEELHHAEQFRRAEQIHLERLTEELNRACVAVAAERAACERARQALVRAREALAVVERHRFKFFDEVEKALEGAAEEQATENWVARRVVTKAGAK